MDVVCFKWIHFCFNRFEWIYLFLIDLRVCECVNRYKYVIGLCLRLFVIFGSFVVCVKEVSYVSYFLFLFFFGLMTDAMSRIQHACWFVFGFSYIGRFVMIGLVGYG